MSKDQEISLIEGCLKGCKKSQALLFKIFSRKMYGICLGYAKNEDTAKDILQDGFIKIFKNLNNFIHETSLENWIRRIIVNTAIDYYRKSIKMIWVRQEFVDESYYTTTDEVFSRIEEKELLRVVQGLPEGYKMVFNLYVVEGYTHKEIAALLGISEGTSKSQFFHSKKMLKERVSELYMEKEICSESDLSANYG